MKEKQKKVYVRPETVIVPVTMENVLGTGVASYVDPDDGGGPVVITPGGENPPTPGKGWLFDDDDNGGVNDWDDAWF